VSMKSRDGTSVRKHATVAPKVTEHNSNGGKYNINKSHLSSERKYKIKGSKRDLLRDNSEGNFVSNKNIGVSQNQSSLTQQFYSPSDSRKILR
jgi:hypothetical protein